MKAKLQVYDADVHELIDTIDKYCRDFDEGKYGIPKGEHRNKAKLIVYGWLRDKHNKTNIKSC